MIQANELRIGNWISTTHTFGEDVTPITKYWEVYASDFEKIADSKMPEIYNPIALTPEILEKAGFKESKIIDESNNIKYWDIPIQKIEWMFSLGQLVHDENIFYFFDCILPDKFHGFPIKYVHQLQNLYFALTGAELTVNL